MTQAFGAIPFKPQTDEMVLGKGANGEDKSILFDVGDGATNPKLLIDDILKVFNFNKGLDVTGNGVFTGNVQAVDGDFSGANLKVGPGTNTDQFMSFKISGEEVGFKYDAATGEVLQKKKAGDAYKKLGTGSGSGSTGINGFGEDDNANAEDGTTGWANAGGTFIAFDNTAPNEKKVIEGEQSFRFTPSAQNDEVQGPNLNFDFTKFHGRTCELGIEYTGADENLELHVVDANGDILNEDLPNNRKIPARSQTTGPFSVSFQCPTATAIGGDANKGNLRVEIVNVGASVAPAIDWDLTYMGTDRNLGTTMLPDVISLNISTANGSTCEVTSINIDNSGNQVFCTRNSVGNFLLDYSGLGLTSPPTVVDGCEKSDCEFSDGTFPSTTSVNFLMKGNEINLDGEMSITLTKTGADAKKVVNTYKASPLTTESINQFSAKLATDGTVSGENVDWINGNCSNSADSVCTFNSGIFSVAPNCWMANSTTAVGNQTSVNGGQVYNVSVNGATAASVNANGSNTIARDKVLVCERASTDYKKPQTKNLSLAGIVASGWAENTQNKLTIEHGKIVLGPSCSIVLNQGGWIDSLTCGGNGSAVVSPVSKYNGRTRLCFSSISENNLAVRVPKVGYQTDDINFIAVDQTGAGTNNVLDIMCYFF